VVVIAFDHITKNFPGVAALRDVSFEVRAENATPCSRKWRRKSTLGKILAGMYRPEGGRVLIDGHEVRFSSPRRCGRAGVAIVIRSSFSARTCRSPRICVCTIYRSGRLCRSPAAESRAEALLGQIGLDVDVVGLCRRCRSLRSSLVQIAAAVGWGRKSSS